MKKVSSSRSILFIRVVAFLIFVASVIACSPLDTDLDGWLPGPVYSRTLPKTSSRVHNSMNRARPELAITFSTQSSPILTL